MNTSAKARPASFADLAKPEYKGQMAMPSPLYSGAAAIMLGTMTSRSDLGWGYFEKLKAADTVAVRGNGAVLTAVANGEKSYGILVDFMAFNAKAKGSPIDFVFPAEGSPAVTEPVAILKTTQNAAAARAFVDFILSDDGQKLAVSMGYIPAKAGVGMPSWLPAGTRINVMPTDIAKVAEANSRQSQAVRRAFRQLSSGRPACASGTARRHARGDRLARAVRGLRAAVGAPPRRRHSLGAAARPPAAGGHRAARRALGRSGDARPRRARRRGPQRGTAW